MERHTLIKQYMGSCYPAAPIVLRPDLIVYTWVSIFNRPIPPRYQCQLLEQATGVLRNHAQLLFYSRFNMTRRQERDMIQPFAASPLFAVLCLEDMPTVFPFDSYLDLMGDASFADNTVYLMDYLRQLVMYKGAAVRDAVRAYARARGKTDIVAKLTGDAVMYADMDIEFLQPPDIFLTEYGCYGYCVMSPEFTENIMTVTGLEPNRYNSMDLLRRLANNPLTKCIDRSPCWGENCLVVCGYDYGKAFMRVVPAPELRYGLYTNAAYGAIAVLSQMSMVCHRMDWTHGHYQECGVEYPKLDDGPVVR